MSVSLKRRLLTGGAWVVVGKGVTATSTVAISALLARLLTPAEFGDYGLAMSMAVFCAMVAQLGLHQAVVRFVAESLGADRPGRARSAIRLVFRGYLIGAAGVSAILLFGGGEFVTRTIWSSSLLALAIPGLTLWAVVLGAQFLSSETFRGFQDLRLASIFGGVINGVLTLTILAAIYLVRGTSDLSEVIAICVGSVSISLLLGLVVLRRKVVRLGPPEPLPRKEVFSVALPMWVTGVTTYALMRSDVWILGAHIDKAQVGVYFAAAQLVATVSMSLILVNLVVPPFIAEMYSRGETQRLERVLRTTATVAGIPAFLALTAFVLFGGTILERFYASEYRAGATVLALLSIGKLVNVATGSCGVTMGMTGHQRVLMSITLVTSVLTVGASLIVVRSHGAVGVATAVAAGTVFQNLGMWLLTRYYTGMWTHAAIPRLQEVRSLFGRND